MTQRRARRLNRSIAAVLTVGLFALVSGCSGGASTTDLPAGTALMSRSADAMRTVRTASITIEVDPAVTAVPLRSANGRLTADGQAEGSAVLALLGGPPLEYDLVATAGTLYLKAATGGFQQLPLAAASGIYDPTAILDPDRGIAALLSSADGASTTARESVAGVQAYRVDARFAAERVGVLVPGVTAAVPGSVWLDAGTSRLLKAELHLPDGEAGRGGPVTVTLGEYDAAVTITAPA